MICEPWPWFREFPAVWVGDPARLGWSLEQHGAVAVLRRYANGQAAGGRHGSDVLVMGRLEIDRDAASRLGVSVSDIDDALYSAFGQRQVTQYFTQVNTYRVILEILPELQGRLPIRVELRALEKDDFRLILFMAGQPMV